MRAAMVGGVAHHAGKMSGERDAAAQEQQAEAAPAPEAAPLPEAPAAAAPDPLAQLGQLKTLLDSGALTQAEFDAEKAKLLSDV